MPQQSWTSPGNYSWTAPFATKNVTATVIGGGGSGFKDCTGDDEGGGGGGGGFARGTRLIPAGTTLSITVGSGGGSLSCNSRSGGDGGSSSVSGETLSVNATGGEAGYDDSGGGSAGGADAGDITNSGQDGDDDDKGGEGGGAGNLTGNSGHCPGSRTGGRGTNLSGNSGSCDGGKDGATYGAGGGGNDDGSSGEGANGAARIQWDYYEPVINSFTVSNQYSLQGIPLDTVNLAWSTSHANSVSINRGIGSVSASGSRNNESTGKQSVVPGNSPETRSFKLTATGPGGTVESTVVAEIKNDNTPSNSWTTTFTGIEPGDDPAKNLGTLSGVDMPTIFSCSSNAVFFSTNPNGGFSNPKTFYNGDSVYIKMTANEFNTDISGLPSNATFGKTNTKTVSVVPGGGNAFDVSYVTRKPKIKEDFDFDGEVGEYPYEDIDLISNSPDVYRDTQILAADDIEIDMEVKGDDPDIQIKINNGGWQYIRQI